MGKRPVRGNSHHGVGDIEGSRSGRIPAETIDPDLTAFEIIAESIRGGREFTSIEIARLVELGEALLSPDGAVEWVDPVLQTE